MSVRRHLRRIGLVVALAAVAAPAAHADDWWRDQNRAHHTVQALSQSSEIGYPDPAAVYPDDRRGLRGAIPTGLANLNTGTAQVTSQTKPSNVYPDDRRGPRYTSPNDVSPVVSAGSPGFSWSAAGIGAAAGLGLAMVLLFAFVAMRHRGNRGRTDTTVTA